MSTKVGLIFVDRTRGRDINLNHIVVGWYVVSYMRMVTCLEMLGSLMDESFGAIRRHTRAHHISYCSY